MVLTRPGAPSRSKRTVGDFDIVQAEWLCAGFHQNPRAASISSGQNKVRRSISSEDPFVKEGRRKRSMWADAAKNRPVPGTSTGSGARKRTADPAAQSSRYMNG